MLLKQYLVAFSKTHRCALLKISEAFLGPVNLWIQRLYLRLEWIDLHRYARLICLIIVSIIAIVIDLVFNFELSHFSLDGLNGAALFHYKFFNWELTTEYLWLGEDDTYMFLSSRWNLSWLWIRSWIFKASTLSLARQSTLYSILVTSSIALVLVSLWSVIKEDSCTLVYSYWFFSPYKSVVISYYPLIASFMWP